MIDLIIESPTCSRGIACQMPRNLSCTFPRLRSATLFHAKASIHFWFMCVYIERVLYCASIVTRRMLALTMMPRTSRRFHSESRVPQTHNEIHNHLQRTNIMSRSFCVLSSLLLMRQGSEVSRLLERGRALANLHPGGKNEEMGRIQLNY
jgi:hypothetical protein